MSSRPQLAQAPVITNGVMTSTNTVNSMPTIIQKLSFVSYSVVWTGNPSGAFRVEISNDYQLNIEGDVVNAGTWTPITLSGNPVASGSAGTGMIEIDGVAAYAIRLAYTNSGGSGVLNAKVNAKVA